MESIFNFSFDFNSFAMSAGEFLDMIGVLFILAGVLAATLMAALTISQHKNLHAVYRSYRHNMARAILVGLEFLVAGDIIRTVAGQFSLNSVLILGLIVVIRSVLGLQFEMEIDGRWPWKRSKAREQAE